jgi:nucleoid-associated protein YgaU
LRFVIPKTKVNVKVIITDISYGERDGTGDVYANINLREYRKLSAVQTDKTGNKSRSVEKAKTEKQNYVIKKGDTLGAICRKYYGNSSLSNKLATYNGIKNANLIHAGKTLKIPDKSLL